MEKEFLLTQGDLQIPCILSESDYEVRRVVLSVHGLGGSTQDDIQCSIAEEMTLFDSAVYRFDFPAHGASPLDSDFLTLKHCVESVLAVARQAKADYPQVENLCVFATGFGAYVTLVALEELVKLPGNIRLVVQTPSVRMENTILAMRHISRETLWAMERVTCKSRRDFDITYSFYEEMRDHSVMVTHPIPMLILHSEENAYIRSEDIRNFHRINEQSKLVIIPGTTHRFHEEGAWDMVLDLTRDWFDFEQVLLSDWS